MGRPCMWGVYLTGLEGTPTTTVRKTSHFNWLPEHEVEARFGRRASAGWRGGWAADRKRKRAADDADAPPVEQRPRCGELPCTWDADE